MLLDILKYMSPSLDHKHIVMLSMVDKETRAYMVQVLKQTLVPERSFHLTGNGIRIFDANGRAMTIWRIHDAICKVCIGGTDYVLTSKQSGASFVRFTNGERFHLSDSFDQLLIKLCRALKPKKSGRWCQKHKAKIWFEINREYPARQKRLYIRIFIDFKQFRPIVEARGPGQSAMHISTCFQCHKF